MKISELIKELEAVLGDKGDIECFLQERGKFEAARPRVGCVASGKARELFDCSTSSEFYLYDEDVVCYISP